MSLEKNITSIKNAAVPAGRIITLTIALKQINAETGRREDAEILRKS